MEKFLEIISKIFKTILAAFLCFLLACIIFYVLAYNDIIPSRIDGVDVTIIEFLTIVIAIEVSWFYVMPRYLGHKEKKQNPNLPYVKEVVNEVEVKGCNAIEISHTSKTYTYQGDIDEKNMYKVLCISYDSNGNATYSNTLEFDHLNDFFQDTYDYIIAYVRQHSKQQYKIIKLADKTVMVATEFVHLYQD